MRRIIFAAAALAFLGVGAWKTFAPAQPPAHSMADMAPPAGAGIALPVLTAAAESGRTHFDSNCAICHGPNGAGTDQGPPLIHKIYEPSHHGDGAFYLAVRNGVRRHHWDFGDMAPLPGVSESETAEIIVYIREVQRANGTN